MPHAPQFATALVVAVSQASVPPLQLPKPAEHVQTDALVHALQLLGHVTQFRFVVGVHATDS